MNSAELASQAEVPTDPFADVTHSCCKLSESLSAADNSLGGFFSHLFDTSSYPARWNCGAWSPIEGWLHIVSDVAIFLAYFAIPVALLYFVRKRKDVPFNGIFLLFAAFILFCGTGHLLEAVIFYHPIYRVAGLLKFATAAVSWVTVLVLWRLVPKVLELPALITKNELLRRSDMAKNEFLANMSHEIRTPLTSILGFADLLQEDDLSTEKSAQAISAIKKSGTHLLAVINDILDLSKIEAGKLSVEHVKTSLVGVLHEVISLLQAQATGKGIELRSVLLTPVPEFVTSDPTRLRQILLNLVGNAVKFTEIGNVTINVRVLRGDARSQLVIDVEDTGPGMTTEQAEQLFAAFSQGDTTVTRKHGGTGLGLIISLRLASLMGGTVTLLRTQLGLGSCFRLELPVDIAADTQLVTRLECVQSNAIKETQEIGQLSGRILLAEDGPDNQKLIQYHLSKAGATVEIADNGRVALEKLDQALRSGCPFDLLLTDIQMPELDGLSLTRILRQRGDNIPIVALTAHAMAEDRLKCLHAGCSDYATKPINKSALVATCREWIEVSRGQSDAEAAECVAPLPSQLACDPDMAPLVRDFLSGLKAKMDTLREDLAARRFSQMGTVAHQLKGAAGGYGYPEIGEAAALLEKLCASSEKMEPIRLAMSALASLCQRAVAGQVESEDLVAI